MMEEVSIFDSWVFHLIYILLGYATVFVPGYYLVQYVKSKNYIDRGGSGPLYRLVVSCVYGHEQLLPEGAPDKEPLAPISAPPDMGRKGAQLVFCVVGLQVSYLTWGVLQEKIMTKDYAAPAAADGSGHFGNSQFLVFVNRILAFLLAGVYLLVSSQPRHTAPLYKYSYCSFSNVMSSWFQYEALKFVSFPTQVLAKACKVIPVMAMGRLVRGKTYESYEYLTAALISVGMTMFLLGSKSPEGQTTTTMSGVLLLAGYMAFDAFTSNWQGALFTAHSMSSVQMMCGVNLFSVLLTSASLLQQGGFPAALAFMARHPVFGWDCVVLSVCSATGQLFIYYTISKFGPVVFVIIMTVRQTLAVLLSCLLYGHAVSLASATGIAVVFSAVFLRIYASHRLRERRRGAAAAVRSA